jgi:hypothetical protein
MQFLTPVRSPQISSQVFKTTFPATFDSFRANILFLHTWINPSPFARG